MVHTIDLKGQHMYFGIFSDPTFIILIPTIILAMVAQARVNSTYKRYAKVINRRGITGLQAATTILGNTPQTSGVSVTLGQGTLSDHYDPKNRMIRLSPDVYGGNTVAAVAIAAHEAGHALQHGKGYMPLALRNTIAVPVKFISFASWPLLIIGIVIMQSGNLTEGNLIFNIGVFAFTGAVIFHLITLPVEINASRRAIREIRDLDIIDEAEIGGAKKVLNAAAMTYVAALAMAAAQLIRILLIRGRN